ncbi:SNARE domain protein (macronuclear) [Tetrahymena thermophila SB210]|uniref:SNARE domain protein n=1 Tax=Tetrahymena thermophila (strain SB210) TaxID=312017 RepID=I7M349_TETTS|nr:SNARE domain protein [Tetrahymena thermophila SB210]EAS02143.2 SNARE domain protein [Tetrahymena thermophila SB210]|eukprot:XP_001022388.2 SNARE domain protein [Tetrahymena thermophila SB210]
MAYKYQKLNTPFSLHQQGNTVFENSGLSSFNDKTAEFLQKAMAFTTGTKKPKNQEIYSANSFFMKSSALREKIRITNDRLVELNNLQKSSGLFNNEESKINDLMMLIGENIKQVEAGINELERSSADECIRQSSAGHSMYKSIIETIKFTLLKIMDEYKKTTTKRMEDIAHNQQKPLFGAAIPGVERRGPRIQKAQFLVQNNNDDIEGGSSGGLGYKQVDYKEKEQLQVSEAMKKLNTQLQSVYEMFKKIGSMVQFHESMIESIAENTDQAEANVNRSKKNIADAYRDASSSRGLIIKIFLIMIIFAFIYIVFLL